MAEETQTEEVRNRRKLRIGVVSSDKMQKTVVVRVERFVKNPKYGKYTKISKKYKAHNEDAAIKVGDKVTIVECRPLSKDKHFIVIK